MYRTLEYTILFVVMALLQVFLFSRIGVSVYIHPLAYVAFIILLPMEIAPLLLLTLGLLMGVTMDVFMGTAGINTIATLFVAFCRPTLLNLLAGKDEVKDGGIPNVNRLGIKKFIKYASFMVLLHMPYISEHYAEDERVGQPDKYRGIHLVVSRKAVHLDKHFKGFEKFRVFQFCMSEICTEKIMKHS